MRMIGNYLQIALRILRRHKLLSVIEVGSLSLALNVLVSEGYGDVGEEGFSDSVQADEIDVLGGRSIPPKVEDKWKANFMRFDHRDKEGAGVLSTWSPFPGGDGAFISNNCVHYSSTFDVLGRVGLR